MNVEAEILDLKRAVFGESSMSDSLIEYVFDAVSVPNNSWHSIGEVTLAKGKYFIIYGASFVTNATGFRQLHFAVNSTTAGRYSPSVAAVTGEQTRMNASTVYEVGTDSATIKLWAKQNSGSSLDAYGYAKILKL